MPKGRQLTGYALECTSATCSAGPAGAKILSLNFWSHATDERGATMCTVTIDTADSGRLDYCGVSFANDGEIVNSSGSGFCRVAGKHRWTTQVHIYTSVGTILFAEGVLALADNTWTGEVYEWIPDERLQSDGGAEGATYDPLGRRVA